MRLPRWVLGALFAAILAAAILPIGGEASELLTTLVVSSSRSELLHDEIWVLDVRSGVRRNLSRHAAADRDPVAAPDGKLVAFVSDRSGREAVWLARPDGTRLRRLPGPADAGAHVAAPRFAPSGRELAFAGGGAKARQLWIVPLADGPVRRVGRAVRERSGRRTAARSQRWKGSIRARASSSTRVRAAGCGRSPPGPPSGLRAATSR